MKRFLMLIAGVLLITCVADALTLERCEISTVSLAHALLAFPLMTATVVAGIYWQALRLWLKRVPFHTHPKKLADTGGADPAKIP